MNAGPAYRADGRPVAREAFYALACDPRRSVVVEACAGAGKTWMLVSRIVRALLDGAEPHEILAITFTRKAAGEMRERLDGWLREFADPATSDQQRIAELVARGVPRADAPAQAQALAALHGRVLDSGRAVEIRTFHAWFAQLLRAAPFELLDEIGIDPDGELLQDLSDHRAEVMRRFHAALLRDDALRADHAALIAARGRSQAARWFDTVLARRVEFELADQAGVVSGSVAAAVPDGAPPPLAEVAGAAWRADLAALARALRPAARWGSRRRMPWMRRWRRRMPPRSTRVCTLRCSRARASRASSPTWAASLPFSRRCRPSPRASTSTKRIWNTCAWRGWRACCWPSTRSSNASAACST